MAVTARRAAAAVGLWLLAMGLGDGLARELTPAQERMKACNSRAKDKGLEGPERGKFMNACLNGQGKPADLSVRQQRQQKCNAIAKERGLEGAERRGYMTECEKPPAVKNASVRHTTLDCERRAAGRRLEGDERRAYVKGCLAAADEDPR
jgi:hypothetical protein